LLENGRRKTHRRRSVLEKENLKNMCPKARFTPAAVMVNDGFPRSEALWELTPGGSCVRDPQHCFQDQAHIGSSASTLLGLKERTELLPLRLGQ